MLAMALSLSTALSTASERRHDNRMLENTLCSCAADTPCIYDEACANGGLGCGAAGQELCRFCGFDTYEPCPDCASHDSKAGCEQSSSGVACQWDGETCSDAPAASPAPSPPCANCGNDEVVITVVNSCSFDVVPGFTGGNVDAAEGSTDSARFAQNTANGLWYYKGFTPEDAATDSSFGVKAGATRNYVFPNDNSKTVAWSGNVGFRRGCTGSGADIQCEDTTCCSGSGCTDDGDCSVGVGLAPPVALAEFTIQNGQDTNTFYDVSIIGGVNVPVSIEATDASLRSPDDCPENDPSCYKCGSPGKLRCDWDLEASGLLDVDGWFNDKGDLSSVNALDVWSTDDQYTENGVSFTMRDMIGCTGDYMGVSCLQQDAANQPTCCGFPYWDADTEVDVVPPSPEFHEYATSDAWTAHVRPLVKPLKRLCSSAYTYAYDDDTSTFTCGATNFIVTACPNGHEMKWDGIATAEDEGLLGSEEEEDESEATAEEEPSGSCSNITEKDTCKEASFAGTDGPCRWSKKKSTCLGCTDLTKKKKCKKKGCSWSKSTNKCTDA